MENSWNTKLDETKNTWKSKIEELELQLALGKMDATDEFEKRKKDLNGTVHSMKQKIAGLPQAADDNTLKLKNSLEELQVQLALGKAETKDAYEEQKKKIETSMHNTKRAFNDFKKEAGETLDEAGNSFNENLDSFKGKLDTFKLHYALGKADAKDEWEVKRKELQSQVNTIKQKFDAAGDVTEAKWEDFKSDMSKSLDHAKNAFQGMFK